MLPLSLKRTHRLVQSIIHVTIPTGDLLKQAALSRFGIKTISLNLSFCSFTKPNIEMYAFFSFGEAFIKICCFREKKGYLQEVLFSILLLLLSVTASLKGII